MMGSVLEAQQASDEQDMCERISNAVISEVSEKLSLETALLSDQLISAIGTALGKRDAIELADEAARKKPMDVMWSAVSQFQPGPAPRQSLDRS